MKCPVEYGTTAHPGGRRIEVSSIHKEWTAYAVRALDSNDALVAAIQATRAFLSDQYVASALYQQGQDSRREGCIRAMTDALKLAKEPS